MKRDSLTIKDERSQFIQRNLTLIETCKAETRDMTETELNEYNDNKSKIESLDEELRNLEKELQQVPVKQDKNIRNITKMNKSIVKEIRSALENGSKKFTINAETRAMQVTGGTGVGVHNPATPETDGDVVETEVQGILEPLYAESALAKLGVKFYPGLPMGDISIPVMGKGNVGWAGEIAQASASTNSFKNIVMKPNRLTAYVDISKQLIAQDTIGVEAAIRRDIVNALADKLEATIFSDAAATADSPAGILASGILNSPVAVTDFKGLCEQEATVETANVSGEMKYLLNPSAKAVLRSMAKSAKHTQLVLESGDVDGVPAYANSNLKDAATDKLAIYGNWSNLAVASWGDIEVVVDEFTQAVNGCVRLVINAYFDAKVLRKEAFAVSTL